MDHNDPIFVGFTAAVNQNIQLAGTMGILAFIPWLTKILPRSWTGQDLVEANLNSINVYIKVQCVFPIPLNL